MSTLGAVHRYGGGRNGPSYLLPCTAWNCESSRCHQMAACKTLSTSRCSQMAAHITRSTMRVNLSQACLLKHCLYDVWYSIRQWLLNCLYSLTESKSFLSSIIGSRPIGKYSNCFTKLGSYLFFSLFGVGVSSFQIHQMHLYCIACFFSNGSIDSSYSVINLSILISILPSSTTLCPTFFSAPFLFKSILMTVKENTHKNNLEEIRRTISSNI